MNGVKKLLVLASALLAPNVAEAQLCTSATPLTSFAQYVGCAGSFTGTIIGLSTEQSELSGYFGGAWTFVGTSRDVAFGPFTTNPDQPTGTLTFDTPVYGMFVLGLQAGPGPSYSYYQFDGGLGGVTSIPFSTVGTGLSTQGLALELNHASLYVASVVPEPSTYLLLASGLIVVGVMARRRRNTA